MEVDAHVDRDQHVISRRNTLDWAVESNRVVRNHDHNLAVKAVTTVTTRFHEAVIYAANLLKRHHASWDIHPGGKAIWVVDEHHQWGVLFVTFGD